MKLTEVTENLVSPHGWPERVLPRDIARKIADERNTAMVVATDAIRELERILETGDTFATREIVDNLKSFLAGDSPDNAEVKCGNADPQK